MWYQGEFYTNEDFNGESGRRVVVDIYDDVSTQYYPVEIRLGGNPLAINYEGEGDSAYSPVMKGKCALSVVEDADAQRLMSALLDTELGEVKVRVTQQKDEAHLDAMQEVFWGVWDGQILDADESTALVVREYQFLDAISYMAYLPKPAKKSGSWGLKTPWQFLWEEIVLKTVELVKPTMETPQHTEWDDWYDIPWNWMRYPDAWQYGGRDAMLSTYVDIWNMIDDEKASMLDLLSEVMRYLCLTAAMTQCYGGNYGLWIGTQGRRGRRYGYAYGGEQLREVEDNNGALWLMYGEAAGRKISVLPRVQRVELTIQKTWGTDMNGTSERLTDFKNRNTDAPDQWLFYDPDGGRSGNAVRREASDSVYDIAYFRCSVPGRTGDGDEPWLAVRDYKDSGNFQTAYYPADTYTTMTLLGSGWVLATDETGWVSGAYDSIDSMSSGGWRVANIQYATGSSKRDASVYPLQWTKAILMINPDGVKNYNRTENILNDVKFGQGMFFTYPLGNLTLADRRTKSDVLTLRLEMKVIMADPMDPTAFPQKGFSTRQTQDWSDTQKADDVVVVVPFFARVYHQDARSGVYWFWNGKQWTTEDSWIPLKFSAVKYSEIWNTELTLTGGAVFKWETGGSKNDSTGYRSSTLVSVTEKDTGIEIPLRGLEEWIEFGNFGIELSRPGPYMETGGGQLLSYKYDKMCKACYITQFDVSMQNGCSAVKASLLDEGEPDCQPDVKMSTGKVLTHEDVGVVEETLRIGPYWPNCDQNYSEMRELEGTSYFVPALGEWTMKEASMGSNVTVASPAEYRLRLLANESRNRRVLDTRVRMSVTDFRPAREYQIELGAGDISGALISASYDVKSGWCDARFRSIQSGSNMSKEVPITYENVPRYYNPDSTMRLNENIRRR